MVTVREFCSRVMLIDDGKVTLDGDPAQVVDAYLSLVQQRAIVALRDRVDRQGSGALRFVAAWVENQKGESTHTVLCGEEIKLVVEYEAEGELVQPLSAAFTLHSAHGLFLAELAGEKSDVVWRKAPRKGRISCALPRLPLNSGHYYFNVRGMLGGAVADWVQSAGRFQVEPGDFYRTGHLPSREQGPFLLETVWDLKG
jgi:lipopolysaccharide transport system ATP-binding protein